MPNHQNTTTYLLIYKERNRPFLGFLLEKSCYEITLHFNTCIRKKCHTNVSFTTPVLSSVGNLEMSAAVIIQTLLSDESRPLSP